MATSSGSLEDHITCCVCIDVYRDPQALRCLHSLCRECVAQLEEGGRVQCPECREYTDMADVKKDFKTQALVDLYDAKKIVSASQIKEKPEAQQMKLCEMCDEADKCITCKCEDCEQYLCDMCEKKHTKLKICKNHKITPVHDIVKIAQAKLMKTLQMLKSEKEEISKKTNGFNHMLRDINKTSDRQVEDIKHYKEEIIKKIQTHCEELIKNINTSRGDSITKLKTLKKHCSKSENVVESQIQLVYDLIEGRDISVLIEAIENIEGKIKDEVRKRKYNLPKIDIKPVSIRYSEDWDPENIVSVVVNVKTTLMQNNRQVIYSELLNHTYNKVKEVPITNCKRMCKVNNELWGIGNFSQIQIYNEHCKLLRIHKLTNVSNASSITYLSMGNGSVIIAHDNKGLHQYNMKGQHIAEISTDGKFADVFCDQLTGRLYALIYHPSISVLVFIDVDGGWVKESNIAVEYNQGSCYDRLWVCQDKIYISSGKHNCIYAFTNDGKQLWRAGEYGEGSPGKIYDPELSSVDSEGNILIADYNNNMLQLYNPDIGEWGVLRLDEIPVQPRQAVIGGDGQHIWVTTDTHLIKYSIS